MKNCLTSFYLENGIIIKKIHCLLHKRKLRIFEKVTDFQIESKLCSVGIAIALIFLLGNVSAQKVKQEKNYANAEMFVQMRGEANPFGSKNPFDGIIVDQRYSDMLDLDGNGRLDIITGSWYSTEDYNDEHGFIRYYKNTGTLDLAEIEEQTGDNNPFNDIEFNSLPIIRFADLDNDGDFDLVAMDLLENSNSIFFIRYFNNSGSSDNPQFEELTGAGNPFNYFEFDRSKGLNFVDIDGDSDLDLYIGIIEPDDYYYVSKIIYVKNTGSQTEPDFQIQSGTNNLLNEYTQSGDYNLTPLFSDFDGDEDFDLLIRNRYFENTGSTTEAIFEEQFDGNNPFIDKLYGTNIAEIIDYDFDGDKDIFTCKSNISYYENIGSATSLELKLHKGIKGRGIAMPEFADTDDDGDLDMIVGTIGDTEDEEESILFYKNVGTTTIPVYEQQTGYDDPFANLGSFRYSYPALVDIDGDGDLDLFNTSYSFMSYMKVYYFENVGSAYFPEFVEQSGMFNPLDSVEYLESSLLDFVDIDNDGDYDCFVGTALGLKYYKNIGSAENPVFNEEISIIPDGEDYTYLERPTFEDIDADGDFDCVIGMYRYANTVVLEYYKNIGTATDPDFQFQTETDNPFSDLGFYSYYHLPTFADLNGDGAPDFIIGADVGSILYFENTIFSSDIELEILEKLKIYPNPANNTVQINFESISVTKVKLQLYDYMGKQVEFQNFKTNKIELDISHLPSGIYFVKIKNGDEIMTSKIIKQ